MIRLIALAALLVSLAAPVLAQPGQPSDCSGTATGTASNVSYPKSGATGPTAPTQFVTINNPSAADTLWVCAAAGCTAVANGAGSVALAAVGAIGPNGISWWRPAYPPPQHISIISSGTSTSYSCIYQ